MKERAASHLTVSPCPFALQKQQIGLGTVSLSKKVLANAAMSSFSASQTSVGQKIFSTNPSNV
jgi:hypothetical protein